MQREPINLDYVQFILPNIGLSTYEEDLALIKKVYFLEVNRVFPLMKSVENLNNAENAIREHLWRDLQDSSSKHPQIPSLKFAKDFSGIAKRLRSLALDREVQIRIQNHI